MRGRDLLSISDLSPDELDMLIRTALSMKRDGSRPLLEGKTVALLFEKPSLRTRVSFEVGMKQLGGTAIYLSQAEVGLGQREPVRGRGARAQPLRLRHRRAHLRAADAGRPRGARRRAGGQRPLRRRAPLPGAGRPADRAREEGPPRRRAHRLHRRRQQRVGVAGGGVRRWPARSSSSPRRRATRCRRTIVDTARRLGAADRRRYRDGGRARGRGRRAPTWSTRTSGPPWGRSRSGGSAWRPSRATRWTRR